MNEERFDLADEFHPDQTVVLLGHELSPTCSSGVTVITGSNKRGKLFRIGAGPAIR